ncbi:MAG: hypothetical protein ABIQ30_16905 [Devosia sp.]
MNQIFQRVEADVAISISDLKKNPSIVFETAKTHAVAVLNHNKVIGYIISPVAWEGMLEALDDLHIIEEIERHKDEVPISVSLDELSGPIHRKRASKLERAVAGDAATIQKGVATPRGKSTRARSAPARKG